MSYRPLTRDELVSVIEGCSFAERIPVLLDFWVHPDEFGDRKPVVLDIMNRYVQDAQVIDINMPDVFNAPKEDIEYRWVNFNDPNDNKNAGMDAKVAISDWGQLDDILRVFPDPRYKGLFPDNPSPDGRYRLGCWWFCLFERHWQLRGMSNALMDYYTDPDYVHQLFRAVTNFYLVMMERAKIELDLDGIFTSDDFGMQTGPFFSAEIFDAFFKPYYNEIIDKAHSLGMHFWLHTCGNIEPFLPKFIDLGLDVIHPIQKYAMEEKHIAEKYGKDICIWAGFDVQQIIPWGTPEEVRQEIRYMMDTYYRKEGKLMFTAGNGINGDCPVDSLEALYGESFKYGTKIARQKKQEEDEL